MRKPGPGIDLIAIPYEATTSFRTGCGLGPAVILQAVDEVLGSGSVELGHGFSLGDADLRRVWIADRLFRSPEAMIAAGQAAAGFSLAEGRRPLALGGEHTVTLGPLSAVAGQASLGVIQFDAHGDLRDTYEGSRFSHACVMRRVRDDLGLPAVQLGVRAASKEEADAIRKHHWPVFTPAMMRGRRETAEVRKAIRGLPEEVYLTFDLDGLDPSEAPGVGTPEPGGLAWTEACDWLRFIAEHKRVVAADIVELLPSAHDLATPRLAARLVERLAGLLAR